MTAGICWHSRLEVTTCSKSPLKMASAFLSDVAICLCQAKFTGVAWLVALSSVVQLRLEI